jgi:HEAT repeat protein
LIECLQDENRINRGSAATALGRIGSAEAVEPLIKCLRDVDYGVRASAVTALGRIASEIPIPHLAEVIGALVDEVADRLLDRDAPLVRMLLRSAFRSANLEMVRDSIQIVMSRLSNAEALCAPYVVALEYLQSNRDPAIMERQHPEMREAMQLLVDAFDEGRAYVTAPKIK